VRGLTVSDRASLSLEQESRSHGDIATVALAAGGAALVAGAIVWLTAPHVRPADDAGWTLVPEVGRDTAQLLMRGRWQ
jgi:hypothetical protein